MIRSARLLLATGLVVTALAPIPRPAHSGGFVAPEERTLPNGLRVAVFPRPGSGFVQVQISLPAGTAREAPDQRGAAPLVAQLIRQGTSSRSAETFGDDVDRLGGSLTSAALRENAVAGGAFLPGDLNAGLELLSDAILHPIFDPAACTRAREQALRELIRLHADPVSTSSEQLWTRVLAGEPGAREPLGDLVSLFALRSEALRAFHAPHYRPDHALLAIAGDVTAERAFAAATEWFGRWSGHAPPSSPATLEPLPAGTRLFLIDRPDLPTATVRLGWRLPGRDAEDDLARTVAFDAFGEALRSRLEKSLPPHGDLGLEFTRLKDGALFEVGFTVPADSARTAIERARRAVRNLRGAALDPARAANARSRALATFPLYFDTPGGTIAQWLAAAATGSDPRGALGSQEARMRALDAATLTAALQRGWDADRATAVVIGPAAPLRDPLARLGSVSEVKLDVPPSAAAGESSGPPSAADRALGRERVAQMLAAHGGLKAIRAVEDQVCDARVWLVLQGQELNGTLTQVRKEPMKMITLTSFESVESRQVLSGDESWTITGGGSASLADSNAVRAQQIGFASDVPHLLLSAADSTAEVAARGTIRVGSIDAWVVDVTPRDGARRRLFIDPASHHLVAMDQVELGARGSSAAARRLYRDIRPVGDLQMPFEEERQIDGKPVMRLVVTSWRLNTGVAESEFRMPPRLRESEPR